MNEQEYKQQQQHTVHQYRTIKRCHLSDNTTPHVPSYLSHLSYNNNNNNDADDLYYETHNANYFPQITNYVITLTLGVHIDVGRMTLWLSNTERKPNKFAAVVIRLDGSANGTTCLLFRNGKMVVTGGKTYSAALLSAHLYRLSIETVPQPVILRYKSGKQNLGISALARVTSFNKFSVENIVGSGKIIDDAINLASLVQDYPSSVWIPELFPGLKYTINLPPIDVDESDIHTSNQYKKSLFDDDDDDDEYNFAVECFKHQHHIINKLPSTAATAVVVNDLNERHEGHKIKNDRKCTALIFDTGRVVITGAQHKSDVYYAYNHCRELVRPYKDDNAPIQSEKRFEYRVKSMMAHAKQSSALIPINLHLNNHKRKYNERKADDQIGGGEKCEDEIQPYRKKRKLTNQQHTAGNNDDDDNNQPPHFESTPNNIDNNSWSIDLTNNICADGGYVNDFLNTFAT